MEVGKKHRNTSGWYFGENKLPAGSENEPMYRIIITHQCFWFK